MNVSLKVCSVLILSLLFLGCGKDREAVLNGRVEAYLSDLGPRTGGRLVELKVREGQRVKAGDLLARLAAEELDAAVNRDQAGFQAAQARKLEADNGTRPEDLAQGEARVKDATASLALAKDTLARMENLYGNKMLSQVELAQARTARDRAEAALHLQTKALAELRAGLRKEQRMATDADTRRAEAVLQQSRAQASFTEIRAPFDGIVIHRLREEGSVIGAGQTVLTLARLDRLWVKLYIPQPIQPRVQIGMALTVNALDGRAFNATLDEVSSESEYTPKMVETAEERVNLVYPARVHIEQGFDKGLLPGTSVEVRIPLTREK